MALSRDEMINLIHRDEPDYGAIKDQLKAEDIDLLTELANSNTLALATKTLYCLGYFDEPRALETLSEKSSDKNPLIRLAVAYTLRNMKKQDSRGIARTLLHDEDPGVRRVTLNFINQANFVDMLAVLKQLVASELYKYMQDILQQTITKLDIKK